MFKVVLPDPPTPQITEQLRNRVEMRIVAPDQSDLAESLIIAEALLVRLFPVTAEVIAQSPHLKVIGRHGVGVDTVDVAAATTLGIPVVHTPQANSDAVAEHAVMLMLAVAKRLVNMDHTVREQRWTGQAPPGGLELRGKTAGIVGMGQVGRRVAHLCGVGFGMKVLGYDPLLEADQFPAFIARTEHLGDLLSRADIVSLHIPLTPETHHLINTERLAQMKPGAILINTARGGLVDAVALADTLTSGCLTGAALDVFEEEPPRADNPLLKLDAKYVTFTPHAAGRTDRSLQQMAEMVCNGILAVLNGDRPSNVVNPEVWG
jgi:D-3-phosphoglycerate dehydrogenase